MTAMFNPPHPGKIVAEQLEYLNVSIREFSRNIGVAPSSVSRIIKGKSPISAAMAVCFSSALPSPTHETWLAMQSEYDAWQARQIVNTSLIKKYEPLNQHA